MVISTGTIRPSLACACVAALNSLQNPMLLTPCWPSAGPTGGDGFAFPAGSCSFTIPVTFFAIAALRGSSGPARGPAASHLGYVFSTCMKSSSTGVARPKIETSTRTRPLSGFTSSTVPLKFENGPSTTRTLSPSSNSTFGLGFRAPSLSWVVSRAISCSLTAGGLVALPTNPVIFGVFFTRCQVRSLSSICTRMYPGKNLRFEARFSPFTISTTFSIGIRMSPKNSSSAPCLIFSSRDFFALFSKPEYVWTTYHFLSIFFCSAAIGISSLESRVLDLVRDPLPGNVEDPEHDGGNQAEEHHRDGGSLRLGEARPAHLAQLGDDLQRDLVRPRVGPEIDGGRGREPEPDHRAPGPIARQRAGERLGGPEGAEDREQHVLEEQARGDREHDVSDGGDLLVRHGSTEAIGRPARTRTWNMRFWRPPLYHWSYWPGWSPTSSPCAPYACGNGGRTWAGPACRSWSACSWWWCSSAPGRPGTPG